MASILFRSNKWQARVSRKWEQSLVKKFQSKEDAERLALSSFSIPLFIIDYGL